MESIQLTGGSKKFIVRMAIALIAIAAIAVFAWQWFKIAEPKVVVTREGDTFVVKIDGKEIAGIARDQTASDTVGVYKQNQRYLYIAAFPEGLSGYLLFDPGVYKVYRFNLVAGDTANSATYDMADLSRGDTAVQAISSDERYVAYAEYGVERKVVIKDLQTGQEFSSPVATHYGQFGSMHFSPDSTKLAYATAAGFPGKESGAVFVVDLFTKQTRLVALTKEPDTYFIVKGWKDNETVDYKIGPNLNAEEQE